MDEDKKKEILFNDNFTCAKCGYYSPMGDGLEISKNFNKILCSICNTFAPIENKAVFEKYLQEKLEWQILETFRNSGVNRGLHLSQKQGMLEKSRQGLLMARPPFGYKVVHGQLVPSEDAENVRLIFKEFAEGRSLNQIAKTYGLSVNGIKKILRNFTYLGKIKFDNQISQGYHPPIISSELFNRVQSKLEKK